jgi:hypothetical protein
MHDWWTVELTRERNAQMLAEAEERRLAAGASVHASPLARALARALTRALARTRARTARKLFGFAFALEREETWRAVWERLEAPKHP